jgi:hypothetical protein
MHGKVTQLGAVYIVCIMPFRTLQNMMTCHDPLVTSGFNGLISTKRARDRRLGPSSGDGVLSSGHVAVATDGVARSWHELSDGDR